ncbi:MAG: tetratricopeptide repeat protein [Bdellovibrio sp.]|nr:tetratricopeptide repeat protein [Bdellovibrio sp.]
MGQMRTIYLLLILVPFLFAGCLKTRSQLRDDRPEEVEEAKPMKAHPVAEVRNEGQYAIEEIKAEFTRLVGRVEDLERAKKDGVESKKIEDKLNALADRVNQMSDALTKLAEHPAILDPDEIYGKAKTQFEHEEYEAAAETLSNYLKLPKTQRAEEATFLRAESYFKLKQYKKAIVDYSKFPEKYHRSTKTPQALLKIGQSFEALGLRDDARGFYEELVEKYPKSAEAKKVRKKVR